MPAQWAKWPLDVFIFSSSSLLVLILLLFVKIFMHFLSAIWDVFTLHFTQMHIDDGKTTLLHDRTLFIHTKRLFSVYRNVRSKIDEMKENWTLCYFEIRKQRMLHSFSLMRLLRSWIIKILIYMGNAGWIMQNAYLIGASGIKVSIFRPPSLPSDPIGCCLYMLRWSKWLKGFSMVALLFAKN